MDRLISTTEIDGALGAPYIPGKTPAGPEKPLAAPWPRAVGTERIY